MTEHDPIMRTSDAVSLRDYLCALLSELDRRYEQRFQAQSEAVKAALSAIKVADEKSAINTATWRANANEWRAAMSDKDKLMVTRNEFMSLQEDIDELKAFRNVSAGKASMMSVIVAYVIALISLIASLTPFLRH